MEKLFVRFATLTAKVAGKPWTFILCLAVVLAWAVTGPIFSFNETWQLVINTGTTIVTFLMVLQLADWVRRNNQTKTSFISIAYDGINLSNACVGANYAASGRC